MIRQILLRSYERMKDYHPDEIIYVVDKRQELHFITGIPLCKENTDLVDGYDQT